MIKQTYTLKKHLQEDNSTTVVAEITLDKSTLLLEYHLMDDLSNYQFQAPIRQQRANNLWKESCFELFIAPIGNEAYWEFNFSPSTQWNCYHFKSYKEGMKESNIISMPIIKTYQDKNRYQLSVKSSIQKEDFNQSLLLNLCVILLDTKGERHFYSINKGDGSPDFHDRGYFALFQELSQ